MMLAPTGSNWQGVGSKVYWARRSQYHRRVLIQVILLLEYILSDTNTNEITQMNFIHDLRLAISTMSAWEDIEALVYETCRTYPVSYLSLPNSNRCQSLSRHSLGDFPSRSVSELLGRRLPTIEQHEPTREDRHARIWGGC